MSQKSSSKESKASSVDEKEAKAIEAAGRLVMARAIHMEVLEDREPSRQEKRLKILKELAPLVKYFEESTEFKFTCHLFAGRILPQIERELEAETKEPVLPPTIPTPEPPSHELEHLSLLPLPRELRGDDQGESRGLPDQSL